MTTERTVFLYPYLITLCFYILHTLWISKLITLCHLMFKKNSILSNFFNLNFKIYPKIFFSIGPPANSLHAIFIVDPLTAIQAGTIWRGKVHVHFWWIVHVSPYSIWIESLFEGQWFSSLRLFPCTLLFGGERMAAVFTPYFSTASRTTRLDDLESCWRWIPLSLHSVLFLENSVMKKDNDLLPSPSHVKYPLFPAPNLFMSFDISCFHCRFWSTFPSLYFSTQSVFLFPVWQVSTPHAALNYPLVRLYS